MPKSSNDPGQHSKPDGITKSVYVYHNRLIKYSNNESDILEIQYQHFDGDLSVETHGLKCINTLSAASDIIIAEYTQMLCDRLDLPNPIQYHLVGLSISYIDKERFFMKEHGWVTPMKVTHKIRRHIAMSSKPMIVNVPVIEVRMPEQLARINTVTREIMRYSRDKRERSRQLDLFRQDEELREQTKKVFEDLRRETPNQPNPSHN